MSSEFAVAVAPERRLSLDGFAYTSEEFRTFFGEDWGRYWDAEHRVAKVVKHGRTCYTAYTAEQFQQHYGDHWEHHWWRSTPTVTKSHPNTEANAAKAKAKANAAKAKAKAKAKANAEEADAIMTNPEDDHAYPFVPGRTMCSIMFCLGCQLDMHSTAGSATGELNCEECWLGKFRRFACSYCCKIICTRCIEAGTRKHWQLMGLPFDDRPLSQASWPGTIGICQP